MRNYLEYLYGKRDPRIKDASGKTVDIDSKLYGTRPFREAFIYEMINAFDKYPYDNASADTEMEPMSYDQKKRLRNQVYKNIMDDIVAHNPNAVNPDGSYSDDAILNSASPKRIVDAFFKIPFIKENFSSKRNQWKSNSKNVGDLTDKLLTWCKPGQVRGSDGTAIRYLRTLVSPYDPEFSDSTAFTRHDEIGYVYEDFGSNGVPSDTEVNDDGTVRDTNVCYGSNFQRGAICVDSEKGEYAIRPSLSKFLSFNGTKSNAYSDIKMGNIGIGDLNITGVTYGSGHTVAKFPDGFADIVASEKNKQIALEGDLDLCGYNILSRYIKTNEDQRKVKDTLLKQLYKHPNDGTELSDEELKSVNRLSDDEKLFITDVCQYFSHNGIPFHIFVDSDDKLAARLDDGSRAEVRLIDRTEKGAQYQGRIYCGGQTVYIGEQMGVPINQMVKEEDRMNMIRWYFGDKVEIGIDDNTRDRNFSKDAYREHYGKNNNKPRYVGEGSTLKMNIDSKRVARHNGSKPYVTSKDRRAFLSPELYLSTETVDKIDENGKIVYGPDGKPQQEKIKNLSQQMTSKQTNGNGSVVVAIRESVKYPQGVPISIIIKNGGNDNVDSDEVTFAKSITISDAEINDINKLLPKLAKLPVDKAYKEDLVTNVETGEVSFGVDINPEHFDYYRRLMAREELNRWMESAKANHSSMVDIDGMIAKIDELESIQKGSAKTFPFETSGDEVVVELQKKYWGILTGADHELAPVDKLEAGDYGDDDKRIIVGDSKQDRIDAVRQHYADWVEYNFGRIPELERDGINVHNTSEGYRPSMIAKYTTVDNSFGVQRNYEYVQHMIMELKDDYNPDDIRTDEYVDRMTKNSLIRYDDKAVVGAINWAGISDQIGTIRSYLEKGFTPDTKAQIKKILNGLPANSIKNVDALLEKPVTFDMLLHTAESLAESGCYANSIQVAVDENGVIKYSGVQSTKPKSGIPYSEKNLLAEGSSLNRVTGTIGQIFEPDQYGAIHPKTVVDTGKVFIPGYDAYLVDKDPEHPVGMRERLRLSGWEMKMKQAISRNVRTAMFSNSNDYSFVSHTTDLNVVYKNMYDTDMSEDYYQSRLPKNPEHPTPEEKTFLNVIKTLKGRCRFPNEYGEGATTMAQSMLDHPYRPEAQKYDYYYSDKCDNENLRVMTPTYDNMFDPELTATAKNQGIVRYLAEGAVVNNRTGKVSPAVTKSGEIAHCALMNDELFKHKDYDTWDRRLMAGTQVLTALHTPRKVGVAMMTVRGWNFDDGFLVSKKFAEENAIVGADGEMRPLTAQDKLSDLHGNKGVNSKIIDPDFRTSELIKNMEFEEISDEDGNSLGELTNVNGKSYCFGVYDWISEKYGLTRFQADKLKTADFEKYSNEYANLDDETKRKHLATLIQKEEGLYDMDDIMEMFAENEHVDIVMSPYSLMSRFNGGSVLSCMENEVPEGKSRDLKIGDKVLEGAVGYTDMIVVDMPADVKTHFYDHDAVLAGSGRKASSQLAWALQSKGAITIMNEFYGGNDIAVDDIREYAITIGLDFDTEMRPRVGYAPQTERGEKRTLLKLPDLDEMAPMGISTSRGKVGLSLRRTAKNSVEGLKYDQDLTNEMLMKLNETGGFMELPFQLDFKTEEYAGMQYNNKIPKDAFLLQATGQTYTVGDKEYATYGMPVLPQRLRSGQELYDGTAHPHDYTMRYLDIYRAGFTYMACQKALEDLTGDNTAEGIAKREALNQKMEEQKSIAQSKFDEVTSDICNRRFSGKHNLVRDELMATRTDHSATAVWSADPRLDIDEVAMSMKHAQALGIYSEDGKMLKDGVLVWRDPLLRDAGVRYLKPKIDNSIIGCAINPIMDKSFDGDFDGDSVALVALSTDEARKQAYKLFSPASNLLDTGAPQDENGNYPLFCQDGLDVAAAMAENPALKTKYNELVIKINDIERKAADPEQVADLVYTNADGKALKGESAVNVYRKQYMNELSEWSHEVFKPIGLDYIDFRDEKTVMASLQRVVDHKAKGDSKKLLSAAASMGITYEVNPDGKVNLDTVVVNRDKNGRPTPLEVIDDDFSHIQTRPKDRDYDMRIQETNAYKADNTAQGGTIAQRAVAALRDEDIHAGLELTYPVTQAILQSKHDPLDAKAKDGIVRFWGQDCWNGYKLTGFDGDITDWKDLRAKIHKPIKVRVLDDKGEPIAKTRFNEETQQYEDILDDDGNPVFQETYVKCTKEEWIRQMTGMYNAFKVKINPEYIERLADIMVRDTDSEVLNTDKKPISVNKQVVVGGKGTVAGLEEYASEHGTLMDKMAYLQKMKCLLDEALKSDSEYVASVSGTSYDYKVRGKRQSLFGNAPEHAVEIEKLDADRMAFRKVSRPTPEQKALRDDVKEKFIQERDALTKSAGFTPQGFRRELWGDQQRKETGEDTFVISSNIVSADAKQIIKKPRPMGCKENQLTEEAFNNGGTYMGESQDSYVARRTLIDLAKADEAKAASVQKPIVTEKEVVSTVPKIDTVVSESKSSVSTETSVKTESSVEVSTPSIDSHRMEVEPSSKKSDGDGNNGLSQPMTSGGGIPKGTKPPVVTPDKGKLAESNLPVDKETSKKGHNGLGGGNGEGPKQ